MKIKTKGWGNSMVATKYVHENLDDIQEYVQLVSRSTIESMIEDFLKELEHNYKVDTGKDIYKRENENA